MELKRGVKGNANQIVDDVLANTERRVSRWAKLKRIVGYVLLYKKKLRQSSSKGNPTQKEEPNRKVHCDKNQLAMVLIERAEHQIIKAGQRRHFSDEIKLMESNKCVKKSSSIYNLDPYIDGNGLLRVGGQLNQATMDESAKFPLLIPKGSIFARLIISWCHEKVGHSGRGITINLIRSSGFYIINCNATVKLLISRCVSCRRLGGNLQLQNTASLPRDRICEEPPFTYYGVQLFGPFVVKEGRKELKRYGTLFTCLSSRAIHFEAANSLSTGCFLKCLRRFIGQRENVRLIRSDNGKNFVGASAELTKAFTEMNHQKINQFMQDNGGGWMSWKRKPPAASSMGGVWDRQIRSARRILESLLKTNGASLSDESLRTLLVEVEAIVNSRPLTTDLLSDANSLIPLSPINLLTIKSKVVMPPSRIFSTPDIYSRKHWRRAQHISNEFWDRWRKEVLMTLQGRQKWNSPKRNCKVGGIVLLKDEAERNRWPMAKIIATNKGNDGFVRSVRLMLGASNKVDSVARYLERPVNKLVMLVENDES